ncbi:MAG: hypothetical protein Q9194_003555 [Teloschistes cf. exilis]
MADPFSIVAGTAGLLDVCWRVGSYMRRLKASAAKIERDLFSLSLEISALVTVSESIQNLWKVSSEKPIDELSPHAARIHELWEDVSLALRGCGDTMSRLVLLVEDVIGNDGIAVQGKRDGLKKALRKQSKDDDIREIRLQIASHQNSLQIALSALNILGLDALSDKQTSTNLGLAVLSDKIEYWGFKLHHELMASQSKAAKENKDKAISPTVSAAVTQIALEVSLNEHFYIPRAVSSMFTGKADLLNDLRHCLFDSSTEMQKQHVQKRFIIYGLGGSGKTEFCCKFAQDNRQSFWGVFWINASSPESVQHTYSAIAHVGGLEPNQRAAKDWLANLDHPWLLIIDNADDVNTPLDELFPEGDRGTVLVTTRNPLNRLHGTVGEGSYHFEKLAEAEANDLLLRAAGEPTPWSATAIEYAGKITDRLGFLALAILQAGKAIAKRMATLSNYLDVYDQSWQRIRRFRRKPSARDGKDGTVSMNVYSSYEIIFRGLEATDSVTTQDAIQLVKMFSFFSWEDLRVDVLTNSVQHPKRQLEYDKAEAVKPAAKVDAPPQSWKQMLKGWAIWAAMKLDADRSGPILPSVLQDEREAFDEDRLMDALDQLNQLSLIYYQDATDSYSMHPLIHKWVRERPQMSTGEQALWCQAASTTLSRSILFPPLDETTSAVSLRRHLVPHISHVLKCAKGIDDMLIENQKARRSTWFMTRSGFGRLQAIEWAKFSLIYVQNGYFSEAEALQVKTRDYVCARLGMDHVAARRITLFLAGTYSLQVRTNKAGELINEVLQACREFLGPRHPETLRVMNMLGACRRFQGRFKEGRELLEEAIEAMSDTLGPEHEDTLEAMTNLGGLMYMYLDYAEARDLHTKAVDGLTKALGGAHEKTLIAKESLAMACFSFEGDVLVRGEAAHDLMVEVLAERTSKLGKEHPWTLFAVLNLARSKRALGDYTEAERLLRTTIPIAQRNLGENHFGTLAGTTHLAQVLARQGRFDEAEQMFNDVIQRHRYASSARADGEHPDRIAALWLLVGCYQTHGKTDDAIQVGNELLKAISTIGGEGLGLLHPFAKRLESRLDELSLLRAKSDDVPSGMALIAA